MGKKKRTAKEKTCGCGAHSSDFFEIEIHCNDDGVPWSWQVTSGPEVVGGFGPPEHMVASVLLEGLKCWGLNTPEGIRRGSYYISIGFYLGDELRSYLSQYLLSVLSEIHAEIYSSTRTSQRN